MKLNKRSIIAVLISFVFLALVFYNVNFKELISTFTIFNYKILLLILPLIIINLVLRGLRWKCLLPESNTYKTNDLVGVYTIGSTMNIFFPARAGDFFKAYYLGDIYNKSKAQILGSVALERILDGFTVLILLIIATVFHHTSPLIKELITISAIAFTGSLIGLLLLLKFNKTDAICNFLKNKTTKLPETTSDFLCNTIDKICNFTNSFISGFKVLNNPKYLSISVFLSIIIWTIECIIAYQFILNFGYKAGFSIGMFTISFIALASAIPSSSVYIGPFQYAYILALAMYNIPKSSALAIAFVQQTFTMTVITLTSLLYILKNNIDFRQYKNYKNLHSDEAEQEQHEVQPCKKHQNH